MADESNQTALEAAQATIDAFASVGTTALSLTCTNVAGTKMRWEPGLTPGDFRERLPELLSWAAVGRYNVIIRPEAKGSLLIQLDDLSQEMAEKLQRVAFLVIETSPGNFQAWLALPAADGGPDFVRGLRKGTGADAGASGAARLAGSINFKPKYAPDSPTVRLIHAAPGRIATQGEIESLGLVAAAESAPAAAPAPAPRPKPHGWPDYQRSLRGAPLTDDGTPDRSRADYTWCQIAISWGWGVEETAAKLMELSEKAQERGLDYALRTARNAVRGVEEYMRRRGMTPPRTAVQRGAA